MAEESVVRRAEKSFHLFQALQDSLRVGTIAWLASGKFFWELKRNNRFKDIMGDPPSGHQWTWEDFLSMPEVATPYSTCQKLILLYQTFKEKLKLPDKALANVRYYRLKAIAPYIDEKNKDKLLDAAGHLDRAGFEQALLREAKGVEQDECRHDWKEMVFRECRKCNKRVKNERP